MNLSHHTLTFCTLIHNDFVLPQTSRIIELKDGEIINDKQKAAA